MTTTRLLGLLLAAVTVTAVVARTRQAGTDGNERSFTVAGIVTAAPADGHVMVAHEAIEGYMPAMTMPFALPSAGTVPAMAPGDRVTFTLAVGDGAVRASAFEIVGRDEAVAAALHAGSSSASSRLRPGDAVPDVSLVTQAGQPFTTSDLRGHVTAVTFIFTRCPMPEFCPLMVKRFQQVQRAITADPQLRAARLLAVTLDPAFDTPEILAPYATAMQADPSRWQFVTGNPTEVERLTKAFAIHVERNGILIDHTLATAVIGPDGRVIEVWRGNGWAADEVVATLRTAAAAATE